MKQAMIAVLLFGMHLSGLCQNTQSHFYWSRRKAEEIPVHQNIARSTELTPEEKQKLGSALVAEIRPYMRDMQISSEKELLGVVARTRVKLVDLNNDGTPEVLAHAFGWEEGCGSTGNCPFWVFRKTENGFKKLLDTRGPDGVGGMEFFTISDKSTNGFRDIVLASSESGGERSLLVYRFRKIAYAESECYTAAYINTKGGQFRQLKVPEISRCSASR